MEYIIGVIVRMDGWLVMVAKERQFINNFFSFFYINFILIIPIQLNLYVDNATWCDHNAHQSQHTTIYS